MYKKTTKNIAVTVKPSFLADQSSPEDNHYVWAYNIQIENLGADTIQLKSRYWKIIDANGQIQEVHGEGVVGEQPIIKPGDRYEYTSGTPLTTSSGFMSGTYLVCKSDKSIKNETDKNVSYEALSPSEDFNIDVPAFSLDLPNTRKVIN